ncbi:MAG: copper amine oxidase N-terminal domain-containing protein [Syntrophomonadaceae bacterium]|nr:copper amine oxidase N-terminal domain-containing protein [Syntrophomonadaceae bacterium]
MKQKACIVLMAFVMTLFLGVLAPAPPAQAIETIEANGSVLEMVLTETGGVTLNLSGTSKYFKVWDKYANTLVRVSLPYDNILSFDVDGNALYFIVNIGGYTQVYQHDLATGMNQQITTSFTNKQEVQAAGGRVAWFDYGKSALYVRDMGTGAETVIEVPASSNVELSLTPDYIAYTAHNTAQSSVMLYSFATGQSTSIKAGAAIKSGIYMQGNGIVWVEGGGPINSETGYYSLMWGNYVGRAYNAAGQLITSKNASGETVVSRVAANQVYYHNIASGETKLITNNDVNNLQPTVWENYIAWAQTYNGVPEIMLLDMNTTTTTRLTNSDFNDVKPVIDHGCLTYITIRGINSDLYVEYLEASSAPVSEAIPVYINGVKLTTDQDAYIKNNRTMVPMRAIFEALGAEVQWNQIPRSVNGTKGEATVLLYIDQTTAYINGQAVTLDAAAEIVPATARTMVPLRFVGEALGCTMNWDEQARTVYVTY